jgi:hypothetical protein
LLGRGRPTANQPGVTADEDLRFSQRLVWLTLATVLIALEIGITHNA